MSVAQAIRGSVADAASGEPLPTAVVFVVGQEDKGVSTDFDGNFVLANVGVGRQTVMARFVGYEPVVLKEIMVSAGKETQLQILMTESVSKIDEVVVAAKVNKQLPLNTMAATGARMFSVEETSRFAGGASDPARLASSFAGVGSNGATNGISIHGCSPSMLLWRVEGVEVPNPNHFADITGAGAGVFSSLSSLVLGNSDFITGAAPAEYGNTISGVFDMKMRTGNNSHRETAVQVGTLGIDLASEGPIGQNGATYLANYRYSTMGLASQMGFLDMAGGQLMAYQDLNFKFNIPTAAGTFSIWGTGLIDNYESKLKDREDWETLWDMGSSEADQYMAAGGVSHRIQLGRGGWLKSTVAGTFKRDELSSSDCDTLLRVTPLLASTDVSRDLIFDVVYQCKVSPRYTVQAGLNHRHMRYDLDLASCQTIGAQLIPVYKADGLTGLTRAFTSHKVAITDRLTATAGLGVVWFNLNNDVCVEPRASLTWTATPASSVAFGYSLNSRKEKDCVYFVRVDGEDVNRDLELTKAHHFMVSYSRRFGDDMLLKLEPYFTWLYDVPVEVGSSFSVINNDNFYLDQALTSDGKGRNFGLDVTCEHYLSYGYYWMGTASVFKSEYRDAAGLWHQTRYNRSFIANALGGKEWMVGREKRNVFGINGRLTLQGGDRYTPLAPGASFEQVMADDKREVPYDEDHPFTLKTDAQLSYAFSLKMTINKQRTAHHFIVEYLHTKGGVGRTFDLRTHELVTQYVQLNFPNIAYRFEF